MRRLRVKTPSPAMTIACIALGIALSGVGYAAVTLPRNSVGTAQLKKNAVTAAKVKDRSLKAVDFGLGQLPAGAQGPPGPSTGPAGGVLTGSYPNPGLANNVVDDSKVANGSLRIADFAAWTVGGGIGGAAIPANGCAYYNFPIPTGAVQGDLILTSSSTAPPVGTHLSAYLRTDGGVTGGVCNFTGTATTLPSGFALYVYGLR